MKPVLKTILVSLFMLSGVWALMQQHLVQAAPSVTTYIVSKTTDTQDGICNADCSLREAIIAANSNSGADIIQLSGGSIYQLTLIGVADDNANKGDLDVTDKVTFQVTGGGPSSRATVKAGSGFNEGIFSILNSAAVTMSQLIIQGGNSVGDGPGIYIREVTSTVKLSDSSVISNSGTNAGGGINNNGTLIISNVIVMSNTSNFGGGIASSGILTAVNSSMIGNAAWSDGGGLSNGGLAVLQGVSFNGNTSTIGGAVYNGSLGSVWLTNSVLSDNTATNSGGGIRNDGVLSAQNSSISYNTAPIGAAVVNFTGKVITLTNDSIEGNTAGGGLENYGLMLIAGSTIRYNTNNVTGAGLRNDGVLNIINSAIVYNTAIQSGGGIDNHGTLTLTNDTVSANAANDGGGIRNIGGALTLNNVTVAYNVADLDANGQGDGGGISSTLGSTVTVGNSIIAFNIDRSGQVQDCQGSLTSQGYNLIGNVAGCSIGGVLTGNVTNTDPLLGPLQLNAGSTLNHELLIGSPAIDKGSPTAVGTGGDSCAGTDQRGVARPIGGRCDIGSVEGSTAGSETAPTYGLSFTVTKSIDTNDWICSLSDCSLREAVIAANTHYGADHVVVFTQSSYTLTISGTENSAATNDLDFTEDATLDAVGLSGTALVIGGSGWADRIFEIYKGSVTMKNIAVQNGHATGDGGGILVTLAGDVFTMTHGSVLFNSATSNGGGVFNYGRSIFSNTVILLNTSGSIGGGIYNYGSLSMDASAITVNQSVNTGGGVYNGKVMTLTNSDIGFNSLTATLNNGGGIQNGGLALLSNVKIHDNSATTGAGLSSNSQTTTTLQSVTLYNNSASNSGGAIRNDGLMIVTNGVISNNISPIGAGVLNGQTMAVTDTLIYRNNSSAAGGLYNSGSGSVMWLNRSIVISNSASSVSGGAGVSNEGALTVTDSAIVSNTGYGPGSGLKNSGSVWMINATLSGNSTNTDGGGIYHSGSGLKLNNVTIVSNTADSDNFGGGDGGGIFASGPLTLENTLISNNVDVTPNAPDCSGTLISQDYNLIRSVTGCTLTGLLTHTITITDPLIGPLQMNGGSTWTHALLAGSPAIDAGNPAQPGSGGAACASVDQRGAARPQGTACDIGAFESTVPLTDLVALNDSPTTLGQATTFTASGNAVLYQWAFGDGLTGSGSVATHTYGAAGNYTAYVTATNGISSLVGSTPVTITNLQPVANAGPDKIVDAGSTVILTGSASYDPDGHLPLAYLWKQTGGVAVVLSSNSISLPTFSAPSSVGVLTFTLTVTDSHGLASALDQTVVTVRDATIVGLQAINSSPTLLTYQTHFNATVSAGTNITYTWNFGDGSPLGSGANAAHTYPAIGLYTATVTATNTAYNLSAITLVTIVPYRTFLPITLKNS